MGHETAVFSGINHDNFLRRKAHLERWCQDPSSSSPCLDVLQESLELKKINAGLMKAAIIDDLIGDAYAYLYDTVARRLWIEADTVAAEEQVRKDVELAEQKARDAQLQAPLIASAAPSPARNPMMNLSHLMNVDGAAETPPPVPAAVSAASTPAPAPTDSGAEPPQQGEAQVAPSRRKIGVGRREIRICAEACYTKPSVPATTANSTSIGGGVSVGPRSTPLGTPVSNSRPDPSREVQIIINAKPRGPTSHARYSLGDSGAKASGRVRTSDQTLAAAASDRDDDGDDPRGSP